MPVSIESLRPHLLDFNFRRLFVEGLGWDHHRAVPVSVLVNDHEYSLEAVAEKAGFAVFVCSPGRDGAVPPYPIRRKIENRISTLAFEHLIVFVDIDRTTQTWQWVKRESGQATACREQTFHAGHSGEAVLQRLQEVAFTLDDEAKGIPISEVTARVYKAFDVERVTKRYFERFKTELAAFGNFIEGIAAQGDRDWYASLMLNRMMFVYFVQKRGFLDGDINYLRNRLKIVQQQSGGARFQQFYRLFLLRLFHEGLGQPEAQRAPELAALLGTVPFLNGGLFDVHELERENPGINISDAAFERIFDFFDSYRWHLDERPYREDNEINPDVLGYIFEKFINQKQMGAYYTKEDITGYITRNTVIPFLFDKAKKECPVAFAPSGGIWSLLCDDPDRYIYPSVGHGMAWNVRRNGLPVRLDAPIALPEEIAVGINDVSKRSSWNDYAPDAYALQTETWREVIARRQRYSEVRARLESGKLQNIDDLITFNLDIERFTNDVISQSEGPELVRAFWHAIHEISVLDPTCGSGAFLFAALKTLEPLYTACLEGMRGFLSDLEQTERPHSPRALLDFHEILERINEHPSERYFILKSIVLNNLYGVDIMEEAVEICKLRLFLKLVAQLKTYDQIEPLPDIDFNIRAGNTLVGYTSINSVRKAMTVTADGQRRQVFPEDKATLVRIEKEAHDASVAFEEFRTKQSVLDASVPITDKASLQQRLESLREELDRYLASEYGIDLRHRSRYNAWRRSHKPFHWLVEFYEPMRRGGFDVIVGNPPYVEMSKVKKAYTLLGLNLTKTGNLYAICIERFLNILGASRRLGVIVPISSISTPRMLPLMRLLSNVHRLYISNFAVRPSKLFVGVDMNLTILLGTNRTDTQIVQVFSTRYNRWQEHTRPHLFATIAYRETNFFDSMAAFPKLGCQKDREILHKLRKHESLQQFRVKRSKDAIFYHSGGRYFRKCVRTKHSNEYKELFVKDGYSESILCLLSSSLYYWLWILLSDCYHVTQLDVDTVPVASSLIHDDELGGLAGELIDDLKRNSTTRTRKRSDGSIRREVNYNVGASKHIIDRIDKVLGTHYGLSDADVDYIVNYDFKFRFSARRS